MKTYSTKKTDIRRKWHLIDAKGLILGRMASNIAQLLIGKNKVYYCSNLDCGDWVIVINAADIQVTGKKESQKKYRWHTGYPGGFRELTFKQMMDKDPAKVIQLAVSGMLPKNKLRAKRLARLRIYAGEEHGYEDKFKKKSESKNSPKSKVKN